MMGPQMSNGDYFMRAQRAAQQHAQMLNPYNAHALGLSPSAYNPHLASAEPPTPGEAPPEDVTGLRMLDEFLVKRREGKNET